MSTIKADAIQSKTADTDLTISGNGTGVPNLETGTKLNDVALTGAATAALPLTVANGGTGVATHTANGVLIGEGTSAITTVAPSTSGNVLTSDGTDWTSAAAGGGGGWEWVNTTIISSTTSSVEWTGLEASYDYLISFFNWIPQSDSRSIYLEFGTSGSTYGGSYVEGGFGASGDEDLSATRLGFYYPLAGSAPIEVGAGDGFLIGNAANEKAAGQITILEPNNASYPTFYHWNAQGILASTGDLVTQTGGGWKITAEAIVTLRIKSSLGGIDSAVCRLFKRAVS